MSMWEKEIQLFGNYLKIERGLSGHSHEAYLRDVRKFASYLLPITGADFPIDQVAENHILDFFKVLHGLGIEASSQARCLSGLRSFFQFLGTENPSIADPTTHMKSPQKGRPAKVSQGAVPPPNKSRTRAWLKVASMISRGCELISMTQDLR